MDTDEPAARPALEQWKDESINNEKHLLDQYITWGAANWINVDYFRLIYFCKKVAGILKAKEIEQN